MSYYLNKTDKIALLLRGHVRTAFDDLRMYEFIKKITTEYNVDIYIHTFNIKSAGKIYQKNKEYNEEPISENDIKKYFKDIEIKNLVLDTNSIAKTTNEQMINALSKNKFLHMWLSIYNGINLIYKSNIKYNYVINMRIDYFQICGKFYETKSNSKLGRAVFIDIFKNFIYKINKTNDINLTNIDCPEKPNLLSKNKNMMFYKKKKEEKNNYLTHIKYNNDDILYGIDNLFAGKIEYLHKLTYIFVYHMDCVFNFLSEIIHDLNKVTKTLGGLGGPHEAILPLFIKNKLDIYNENNYIIDYQNIKINNVLDLLNEYKYLINFKNKKYINNEKISKSYTDMINFLEINKQKFNTFYEIGCGYGLLFYLINETFKNISKALCYDNFYSPIIEYCSVNTKSVFTETIINSNYDLLFINEFENINELNFSILENAKIILINNLYVNKEHINDIYKKLNKKNIIFYEIY